MLTLIILISKNPFIKLIACLRARGSQYSISKDFQLIQKGRQIEHSSLADVRENITKELNAVSN